MVGVLTAILTNEFKDHTRGDRWKNGRYLEPLTIRELLSQPRSLAHKQHFSVLSYPLEVSSPVPTQVNSNINIFPSIRA